MGGDGFLTLVNQTLEEAMMTEGFSQVFLNDVVAPITRVNYGQSVRINGFVGACFCFGWVAGSCLRVSCCSCLVMLCQTLEVKLTDWVCVCGACRRRVTGRSRLGPVGGGRRQQESVHGTVVQQQE